MIITKKALPRRTFLKGAQAVLALAAARRDDSRRNGLGADAGQAGAEARLRVHADGLRSQSMDAVRGHACPSCRRSCVRSNR